MSDLSPELRELVLASKSAYFPTETDYARVLSTLRDRLGDAAIFGAKASQVAATSASSGLIFGKLSVMSLAGLALLGGIFWLSTSRSPKGALTDSNSVPGLPTTSSIAALGAPTATASSPSAPFDSEATSAVGVTDDSRSQRIEPQTALRQQGRDKLSEEVALLSRAEVALHGGNPALALQALNEHERRFSSGMLVEERIAARVQALCALGRNAEANAQLSRLSPKSLHGAAPGQACGNRKSN